MRGVIGARRGLSYAIAAAVWIIPTASSAQDYPNKSIRYIIPVDPGASPDVVGRILAERLTRLLGQQRAALLPDVPTMHESGVPGFEVNSWYGVVAPAGTPAPILDKLNADFSSVLRMPEIQQRLDELVVSPSPGSRKAFDQFIRAEIARWAQVIKDAGIPKQ